MRKIFLLSLALILPASALAAPLGPSTFQSGKDLLVASSSPGNSYLAAGSLTISAPVAGDLSAAAGTIEVAAPVAGDALLAGGIVNTRDTIAGDLRAMGGRVSITAPVGGDEVVAAGSFTDTAGGAHRVFVAAGTAELTKGANGAVTIYANNVSLAGNFTGDVTIVAGSKLSVAPGTTIAGTLDYTAPVSTDFPSSIDTAHVTYTNASYLPSTQQSRAFAIAAAGVFLLVKVLGALILAGLFAGLFPRLAAPVAELALEPASRRRALLTTLLGFGIIVATPVLLLLLAITFVGLGLALMLGLLYVLLLALAFIYAGITVGALLARTIVKRTTILWRDGVFGMLVLMIFTSIPFIGWPIMFILMAFAAGALSRLFYHFAFPKDSETSALL